MTIKDIVEEAENTNGVFGKIYKINSKKVLWEGEFKGIDKKYYNKKIFAIENIESSKQIIVWI